MLVILLLVLLLAVAMGGGTYYYYRTLKSTGGGSGSSIVNVNNKASTGGSTKLNLFKPAAHQQQLFQQQQQREHAQAAWPAAREDGRLRDSWASGGSLILPSHSSEPGAPMNSPPPVPPLPPPAPVALAPPPPPTTMLVPSSAASSYSSVASGSSATRPYNGSPVSSPRRPAPIAVVVPESPLQLQQQHHRRSLVRRSYVPDQPSPLASPAPTPVAAASSTRGRADSDASGRTTPPTPPLRRQQQQPGQQQQQRLGVVAPRGPTRSAASELSSIAELSDFLEQMQAEVSAVAPVPPRAAAAQGPRSSVVSVADSGAGPVTPTAFALRSPAMDSAVAYTPAMWGETGRRDSSLTESSFTRSSSTPAGSSGHVGPSTTASSTPTRPASLGLGADAYMSFALLTALTTPLPAPTGRSALNGGGGGDIGDGDGEDESMVSSSIMGAGSTAVAQPPAPPPAHVIPAEDDLQGSMTMAAAAPTPKVTKRLSSRGALLAGRGALSPAQLQLLTPAATPTKQQKQPVFHGAQPLVDELFKALASYRPQQDDELVLQPGDQVVVTAEFDDGWAVGQNLSRGGETGVFPMSALNRPVSRTDSSVSSERFATLLGSDAATAGSSTYGGRLTPGGGAGFPRPISHASTSSGAIDNVLSAYLADETHNGASPWSTMKSSMSRGGTYGRPASSDLHLGDRPLSTASVPASTLSAYSMQTMRPTSSSTTMSTATTALPPVSAAAAAAAPVPAAATMVAPNPIDALMQFLGDYSTATTTDPIPAAAARQAAVAKHLRDPAKRATLELQASMLPYEVRASLMAAARDSLTDEFSYASLLQLLGEVPEEDEEEDDVAGSLPADRTPTGSMPSPSASWRRDVLAGSTTN